MTDTGGVEHYLDEIPIGTVQEKLCVNDQSAASMPDGLVVRGDAYIGRNVARLPENLNIGGSLMIGTVKPLLLPESLRVGGARSDCGTSLTFSDRSPRI